MDSRVPHQAALEYIQNMSDLFDAVPVDITDVRQRNLPNAMLFSMEAFGHSLNDPEMERYYNRNHYNRALWELNFGYTVSKDRRKERTNYYPLWCWSTHWYPDKWEYIKPASWEDGGNPNRNLHYLANNPNVGIDVRMWALYWPGTQTPITPQDLMKSWEMQYREIKKYGERNYLANPLEYVEYVSREKGRRNIALSMTSPWMRRNGPMESVMRNEVSSFVFETRKTAKNGGNRRRRTRRRKRSGRRGTN